MKSQPSHSYDFIRECNNKTNHVFRLSQTQLRWSHQIYAGVALIALPQRDVGAKRSAVRNIISYTTTGASWSGWQLLPRGKPEKKTRFPRVTSQPSIHRGLWAVRTFRGTPLEASYAISSPWIAVNQIANYIRSNSFYPCRTSQGRATMSI